MPVHQIEIQQPAKAVLHNDVTFIIKSDGKKLGELKISKGTLDWKPANAKKNVVRLKWEDVPKAMETIAEHGSVTKVKRLAGKGADS